MVKLNYILLVVLITGLVVAAPPRAKFTRLLPPVINKTLAHPQKDSFVVSITNSLASTFTFRKLSFDCVCLKLQEITHNGKKTKKTNIKLKPGDILAVKMDLDGAYYMRPMYFPLYFYFYGITPAVQITKIYVPFTSVLTAKPNKISAVIPSGFTGLITKIKIQKKPEVSIGEIKSSVKSVKATYNKDSESIDVYADNLLNRVTNAWLTINLKGTKQKQAKLYISDIMTVADIFAKPISMDFGVINKAGKIVGKEVVLKTKTRRPWKITGTYVQGENSGAIKTKIINSNDYINIVWAILDGELKKGPIKTKIIISTDHPNCKSVEIPIKGQVISNTTKDEKKQ